jgi:hypothetical protein
MIWLGDGPGEPRRPYISILDKPSASSLISEMLLLQYKANSNLDGVLMNLVLHLSNAFHVHTSAAGEGRTQRLRRASVERRTPEID